ncbi:hypothetical protein [Asticcacaulis sp. YBE204]|uniref:hypothetical protein n=1 Tax=Asticcacaulis sp. YBE204 TaxID=1282363 RepID=UPI0003C3D5E6|nr:hypothetical protein [Asticcacaulis sp. YBE204]ESQ78611.1 hypothetical protein AEYBE204_13755 [Asticcacaulis sp. YBE204]
MRIRTFLPLALAMAALATPVTAAPAAPAGPETIETDFASMYRLMMQAADETTKGDNARAVDTLKAVIRHPRFVDLPLESQFATFHALALSLYANGATQEAYDRLLQAGVIAPALRDADYWFALADICSQMGKEEEALDAVIVVAQKWPDAVSATESEYVFSLLTRAKALDDGGARRLKLLEALYAGKYTSENPFMLAEGLWFDLFEIYVQKGEREKATALAKDFIEVGSLVRLHIDNRYTAFRAAARPDLNAAVDASIKRAKMRAEAHPALIEGANTYALELVDANRPAEALKVIDAALKTAEVSPPSFTDVEEHLNWALDARNYILGKLGRWKDAETAQIKARDYALSKDMDVVSQKLNLGSFYYQQGKPDLALEEVAGVDLTQTSPYGIMVAEEIRACAYAQKGETEKLKASLDFMKGQAKDGYAPLRSALLCANDQDALAALIVAKLDDPDTRSDTLIDVQTYLPEPAPTPYMAELDARRAKIIARPDVQAAVAKYGVILSIPTFRPTN